MPEENGSAAAASPRALSARIERLFEVHRPPETPERRWRNNEVVAACKADGRELSESHLSELRRGVKRNPTMKTLEALAWFFDVRAGYFIDPDIAAEVERELVDRASRLEARLQADREAREEERAAAVELQNAIRASGVTRTAHRGAAGGTDPRQRAAMMRALARALVDDESDSGE